MHEPESVLTDEYVLDSFLWRAASLMPSCISSVSVEGRKLVEEIASLEARLSELKGEYNAQALISKLPPEILSEIFLQQAVSVREERVTTTVVHLDNDPFVHKSFYSWLNVTHVCRQWREVSLNCSQLWTWLAFDPRCRNDVVEALLPRAQNLPLTFVVPLLNPNSCCRDECAHLTQYHKHCICVLKGLKPLIPRLRELILLVEWEYCEDIWGVLSTATYSLESIRIEAVGVSPVMRDTTPFVPAGVFGGHDQPRLRSVVLSNVGIEWPNPILCSSLRYLEPSNCQINEHSGVWRFISILSPLAQLESLHVSWPSVRTVAPNLQPPAPVIPPWLAVVSLPHLRDVFLSGENL